MSSADPFGVDALRAAVERAWLESPSRFREDANAEDDLVVGGYRDRWLVELTQNAADAATRVGRPGDMRLTVADTPHGQELRVANTGAPLDADGVVGLASLRASAKRDGSTVGRFGIGFAAVLPLSDEPRVVSATGGVAFSASRTRALAERHSALAAEVASRDGQVPVLRLAWSTAEPGPPDAFATEVRLPLRSGVDAADLLAQAREQAPDLLLALPALRSIDVAGAVFRRADVGADAVELIGPGGSAAWRLVRRTGLLPEITGAEGRRDWAVCWAVRVDADGVPLALGDDVLHAPTPTDERLSLPARLVADLPLEPTRRRVHPGSGTDTVVAEAIAAYPGLLRLVPAAARTALVPVAGFPLSPVDAALRDGITAVLAGTPWLPLAPFGDRHERTHDSGDAGFDDHEPAPPGERGGDVAPRDAVVLDRPSRELTAALAGLVPGLVDAALSEPRHTPALAAVGVRRLGLAGVVAALAGIEREPRWWHDVYDAIAPFLDTEPHARDDLAALPVPLADGRTVTGPRTTIVLDADAAVPGLRAVHPDAAHPLLLRLGAESAGARELLHGPEMRAAVERSVDDADVGDDVAALADTVLALATVCGGDVPPWLGALALPAADGEWRRADELLLPDAALLPVLASDHPFGVLDDAVAARTPRAVLTAVGVLDGFATVVDDDPTGPDHDLDDEDEWWRSLPEPPRRLTAVRDLDLVDDDAWPHALRILDGRHALTGEYTTWWLARHALLDGAPPRQWRLPGATALAGLYDVAPDLGLREAALRAAGVRADLAITDVDDADDLVDRLADPRRAPDPEIVRAAHAALVDAAAAGVFDADDLSLPSAVRAVSGEVVDASDAYVVDEPWLWDVADFDVAVAGGEPDALARLLDVRLASDVLRGEVASTGHEVPWARLPQVAAVCEAIDRPVPAGVVVLHDVLEVRVDGVVHEVPFWVDGDTVHAADPVHAAVWL